MATSDDFAAQPVAHCDQQKSGLGGHVMLADSGSAQRRAAEHNGMTECGRVNFVAYMQPIDEYVTALHTCLACVVGAGHQRRIEETSNAHI